MMINQCLILIFFILNSSVAEICAVYSAYSKYNLIICVLCFMLLVLSIVFVNFKLLFSEPFESFAMISILV